MGSSPSDTIQTEQPMAIDFQFISNQSPSKPDIYVRAKAMPLLVTVCTKSLNHIMNFVGVCFSTASVEKTTRVASAQVAALIEATQNQMATSYKKEVLKHFFSRKIVLGLWSDL